MDVTTARTMVAMDRYVLQLDDAAVERLLREQYAPHLTPDDYDRLRHLLGLGPLLDGDTIPPRPAIGPATGTIGRHAPESSEPWQAEAAHAFWGIWYGCRALVNEMRAAAGFGPRTYGAALTARAMTAICDLATIVPPELLAEARRRAEGWVAQARRIRDIDEVETWAAVPRVPGRQPPLCPYCRTLSLRMNRARQEVRCFFPGCRDLDGNPTRARMVGSRLSDAGQLVFDDDTVVAYREEDPTGGT